eukprot:scaffold33979_cov60-Phaeocystis_antarctica.AAC.2
MGQLRSTPHRRPHPVHPQPASIPGRREDSCQWDRHHGLREGLEPLVVPPLGLGHLGALRQAQLVEGGRYRVDPVLRALLEERRGLEEVRRRLHVAPRVAESYSEVVVGLGLARLEGDGLAVVVVCLEVVLVGKVA